MLAGPAGVKILEVAPAFGVRRLILVTSVGLPLPGIQRVRVAGIQMAGAAGVDIATLRRLLHLPALLVGEPREVALDGPAVAAVIEMAPLLRRLRSHRRPPEQEHQEQARVDGRANLHHWLSAAGPAPVVSAPQRPGLTG